MYIFLMLDKAKENEKEPCERKLTCIFYHEKNDGLKSGVRERSEKSGGKKGKNRRVWGTTLSHPKRTQNEAKDGIMRSLT